MADGDGNGQITLAEFAAMIFRYAPRAPDSDSGQDDPLNPKKKENAGVTAAAAAERKGNLKMCLDKLGVGAADITELVREFQLSDASKGDMDYKGFCAFMKVPAPPFIYLSSPLNAHTCTHAHAQCTHIRARTHTHTHTHTMHTHTHTYTHLGPAIGRGRANLRALR